MDATNVDHSEYLTHTNHFCAKQSTNLFGHSSPGHSTNSIPVPFIVLTTDKLIILATDKLIKLTAHKLIVLATDKLIVLTTDTLVTNSTDGGKINSTEHTQTNSTDHAHTNSTDRRQTTVFYAVFLSYTIHSEKIINTMTEVW